MNQSTQTPATDETPNMEEMLQQSERKAQEHYDAWMYARAETENIRNRALEDVKKAKKFAVEHFAEEILSVKDSLEAGIRIQNTPEATLEDFRKGMDLTVKQIEHVFQKFHITEIPAMGEKMNPHHHQVISTAPSDAPVNTIIQVLQTGYLLNERVLRPSLVIVAQ